MITSVIHLRVRYAETDRMQFAHHSRYFEWFECGRTELMRQMGYTYRQMEEEGVLLPLVEAGCRYHKPALYDDLLRLETCLREMPRARMRLDYKLVREEENLLLAEGFTVHAFIKRDGRPVKPPEKFLHILRRHWEEKTGAA